MMTVSAVAKLIPKPPARVDNKKTNCGAPGAERTQNFNLQFYWVTVSILRFLLSYCCKVIFANASHCNSIPTIAQ